MPCPTSTLELPVHGFSPLPGSGVDLGVSSLPRGRTLTPHPKPSSVWTEDCGLECDSLLPLGVPGRAGVATHPCAG